MGENDRINEKLDAIDGKLSDLIKLMVSTNHVPAASSISHLANQVANGDYCALKAHNRAKRQFRGAR